MEPLPAVSAIVRAHNRRDLTLLTLDRLAEIPLAEVVVVDNDSSDGTAEAVRARGDVRLIELGENAGIRAANVGARAARADFLLLVDDDSHPVPGALERLLEAFERVPQLAIAAGRIREVDPSGRAAAPGKGPDVFEWFLGRGRSAGPEGIPAFFFPASGALIRREPFLAAGGFREALFQAVEQELTTRLVAMGHEVRYVPDAIFDHVKDRRSPTDFQTLLRRRVRNQLWYLWMHFPPALALRRALGYLAFDLAECTWRRVPGAWIGGIADAWRQRHHVAGLRRPLPRETLRRAELDRGRLHVRYVVETLRRSVLRRRRAAAATRPPA
jgi:GT2 family glycosyltransferase